MGFTGPWPRRHIISNKFNKMNYHVGQDGSDPLLTSALSSWRRLWSRSTSSISYTLISKGSFSGPDIGGKSTHWPAALAFFPREEVSGRGAGISRLLWKPTKPRHSLHLWYRQRWYLLESASTYVWVSFWDIKGCKALYRLAEVCWLHIYKCCMSHYFVYTQPE